MNYQKLTVILFVVFHLANPNLGFSQTTGPITYYISTSGSDSNNGTAITTPWKTLTKVNQTKLKSGDKILFKRGESFYGGLIISQSGASGHPITFGAYGSGALPIINGFTNVTAWTNLGNNIWESATSVSTLPTLNMVVVNGVEQPMGRWPNTGYRTITSHVTNTSITDSSLSGTPNWSGAEVVIRKFHFTLDRSIIKTHSGTTLTYTSGSANESQNGYGYFIQNHPSTLDVQNEWYYNPSTKKLRVFSTSMPTNVKVSSVDNLVYMVYRDFITFDSLAFQGANTNALYIGSSKNTIIQNSSIDFSGMNGVWGGKNWGKPSSGFVLQNSTINHTNNNAIIIADEFSGTSGAGGPIIRGNTIQNTGMIPGLGQKDGQGYTAIETYKNSGLLIEKNIINNTGFIGIHFGGNDIVIQKNLITNFVMVKDDGGGIYHWIGNASAPWRNQKILNNIVINGIGAPAGTADTQKSAQGIYLDDGAANMEVAGNTVANAAFGGFYLHNIFGVNLHDNTSYNNGVGQIFLDSDKSAIITKNNQVKNNIFVSKDKAQMVSRFDAQHSLADFASFGPMDNNYYARPMDDNQTIKTVVGGKTFINRNLADWQSVSTPQDAHSKKSPKTITNVSDLRFEYNASDTAKTITLDANYVDVKNTLYQGKVSLAAWSSVVLVKTAGTVPPSDTVPPTVAIKSPTGGTVSGTITVAATATDNVGVTRVDFYKDSDSTPFATDTTSAYSASLNTATLANGTHTLKAIAYDPAGNKGTAAVTVNIAANLLPAVNPASTVNGLDYKYYEGSSYSVIPKFSTLTPKKTGTTANFNISLANRVNVFSFSFTGFINVPSDGQYTFYTTSDDGSNLYIDNVLVVNNDGLHKAIEKSGTIGLKAGKHAISVGYIQQGVDKVLKVNYAGPGIAKQAIPPSTLFRIATSVLLPAVNPANAVNGLNYKYYEGSSYSVIPKFSTLTPKKTGTTANFNISLANRVNVFSFSFTGFINVPSDGQYTFYTTSDDGSNLYIDNVLVVNNDGLHKAIEKSGTIGLKAGKHAISVGYIQQGVDKVLKVNYAGPGIAKNVVPASALFR